MAKVLVTVALVFDTEDLTELAVDKPELLASVHERVREIYLFEGPIEPTQITVSTEQDWTVES